MRTVVVLLLLFLSLNCRAAVVPILKSVFSTNTYGFGENSLVPTNAEVSNLASGTTDIFTVPNGRRFLIERIWASTTNTTSTTAYSLIKTNGVYYRYAAGFTLNPQSTIGLHAGDNFFLEPGESVAVNTTQVGANVSVTGVLFPTNSNVYSPRLLAIASGVNTVYTCPPGKAAVNLVLPNSAPPVSTLLGDYVNDSGTTRTFTCYVVPSGGSSNPSSMIMTNKSVLDKNHASITPRLLFPGDSITIASDAATDTQWVRFTVAEIPFP